MAGNTDEGHKGSPLVSVSTKVTDVFGLGPALDTLMKALVAGVGVAFGPYYRRRMAAADQEAARGWLEVAKESGVDVETLAVESIEGRSNLVLRAERVRHQESKEVVARASIAEAQQLLEGGWGLHPSAGRRIRSWRVRTRTPDAEVTFDLACYRGRAPCFSLGPVHNHR
jgi:hypothetical protein